MRKIIITIVVAMILIVSIVIAEENIIGNVPQLKDIDKTQIGEDLQNVGSYLGLDDEKASLQGLTKDQKVTIERKDGVVIIKSKGNLQLKVNIDGKEKIITGFKFDELSENIINLDPKTLDFMDGTSFRSDGKKSYKNNEGEVQIIEQKGHNLILHKDNLVEVNDGKISVTTDNKITRIEKIEGYDGEGPEVEFKTLGDSEVLFEDGTKNGVGVKGVLDMKGEKALWKSGNKLVYGGIDFKENSDNSNQAKEYEISNELDSDLSISEKAKIVANTDTGVFKISVPKGENSAIFNFNEDNEFFNMKFEDGQIRKAAIGLNGNQEGGSAIIIKKGEDGVPIMKITEGGEVSVDNKHLEAKDDNLYYYKKAKFYDGSDSQNLPFRFEAYDSEGKPINDNGIVLYSNSNRGFAAVPEGYFDNDKQTFISNRGTVVSPSLEINKLPDSLKRYVNRLNPSQLADAEKNGFYSMKLKDQINFLKENYNLGEAIPEPEPLPEPEPAPEPEPVEEPEPVQPTQPTEPVTTQPTIPEPVEPEPTVPSQPTQPTKPTGPQPYQPSQGPITYTPVLPPLKLSQMGASTIKREFSVDSKLWNFLPAGLTQQQFYDYMKNAGMETKLTAELGGAAGFVKWFKDGTTSINGNDIQKSFINSVNNIPGSFSMDPTLKINTPEKTLLGNMLKRELGNTQFPKGSQIILKTDQFGNPTIEMSVVGQNKVTRRITNINEKIVFNKLFRATLLSNNPDLGARPIDKLYENYQRSRRNYSSI